MHSCKSSSLSVFGNVSFLLEITVSALQPYVLRILTCDPPSYLELVFQVFLRDIVWQDLRFTDTAVIRTSAEMVCLTMLIREACLN